MTSSCKSRAGFWTGRENAVKVVKRHKRDSAWVRLCRGRLDGGGILTKNTPEGVGGHVMSSGVKTKEVVVGGTWLMNDEEDPPTLQGASLVLA